MSEEQFRLWITTKAKYRQIKFINRYLKTLDINDAMVYAGYSNKGYTNRWKIYHKLLPYIQYLLQHNGLNISKQFITAKWLKFLEQGQALQQMTALKQLSKIYNYADNNNTKIDITSQQPITINFENNDGN